MRERISTVTLSIANVWDVIGFDDRIIQDKDTSSKVLEAFAQLFIDTPLGDEIGAVWKDEKGGRRCVIPSLWFLT